MTDDDLTDPSWRQFAADMLAAERAERKRYTAGSSSYAAKASELRMVAWEGVIARADQPPPEVPPDPAPTPTPTPPGPPPTGARPTSRSQVGPRIALTDHPGGVLRADFYAGLRFTKPVVLPDGGAYGFTNCQGWFDTVGYVPGRTVLVQWSRFGGYAEGDGFSGFVVTDSLLAGNVETWRPTGRESHDDITTPTPFKAYRTIFSSEGPVAENAHCNALHLIGGRGGYYEDCWFLCEPRTNSNGSTKNSTPCQVELGADQRFVRCRMTKGGAYHAAYARGPRNQFDGCVVDEPDGSLRPMTTGDIMPNPAYRDDEKAYVNGVRVP